MYQQAPNVLKLPNEYGSHLLPSVLMFDEMIWATPSDQLIYSKKVFEKSRSSRNEKMNWGNENSTPENVPYEPPSLIVLYTEPEIKSHISDSELRYLLPQLFAFDNSSDDEDDLNDAEE